MRNTKERVTIYQVAKKAQVSLATVSRVINKKGNVTEGTRLRVEAAIKELGYKPSGLAQALATNKTTNIALIIPSANYVYIANLLNGITEVTKEKGFTLGRTSVVAVEVPDRPGGLDSVLQLVSTHDINVEYMYAFLQREKGGAILIFRFDKVDQAIELLREHKFTILPPDEICAF